MNMRQTISVVLLALSCAGLSGTARAQEPCREPICAQNTSQYKGDRRWDWTVFIDPRSRDLARIKCVEYTLHPTFPNPVRIVCNMGSVDQPFALRSNGWGTFAIKIRVLMQDGSFRDLTHQLSFQRP